MQRPNQRPANFTTRIWGAPWLALTGSALRMCPAVRRSALGLDWQKMTPSQSPRQTPPRVRRHALALTAVIDQSTPPMTPPSSETRGRPPEQTVVYIFPVKSGFACWSGSFSHHSATRLICRGFTGSESFSLMHSLDPNIFLFERNVPPASGRCRREQNF